MNKFIETHRFFSNDTQRTFYENLEGYVNREMLWDDRLSELKQIHKIESIYRFDLGQNPYGSSEKVVNGLHELLHISENHSMISQYPEFNDIKLRQKISRLYGIRPEWIIVSAGLDQMIDLLASIFLNPLDKFVTTSPGFFLFGNYSRKHGGVPIQLELDELKSHSWSSQTTQELITILRRLGPKIIWISNPNNPTGALIEREILEEIIQIAQEYMCFIVIDEAYGEYSDQDDEMVSASEFLGKYKNLICLRTFSKAYGLAGMRVGYMMTSNLDILKAARSRIQYYPITRLSYEATLIAIEDQEFIHDSRSRIRADREELYKEFSQSKNVNLLQSDSQTVILRVSGFEGGRLHKRLLDKEILSSPLVGDDILSRSGVRLSIGTHAMMKQLSKAIKSVSRQL